MIDLSTDRTFYLYIGIVTQQVHKAQVALTFLWASDAPMPKNFGLTRNCMSNMPVTFLSLQIQQKQNVSVASETSLEYM